MAKLEVETVKPHKIYAQAEWRLKGKQLTEKIPYTMDEQFIATLSEGDNIRLNEEVYHVTKVVRNLVQRQGLCADAYVYFTYTIQKGKWTPEPWIKIGDVLNEE